MQAVRDALDALTMATDGVDGSSIYIYGEGWNFGEVANDARFIQATQLNLGGTGIGTFSDRLRDAVRGGGPFDDGADLRRNQGVINGLFYDPNSLNSGAQSELDELLLSTDQIRVGLAGNLADYEFVDRNGDLVTGAQVDYNGSPTGYTADPQEHIVYVSKHDNQTLFDINQYHNPVATSLADRVRTQNLGIDFTMLSQGVPFFHAGVDLLRSKSLDRDSFNSGDWFNRLDFTYQDNNWAVGLPVAGKNQSNWPTMQPLLADPSLDPGPDHIAATQAHMQEMLAVRASSALFRLTEAAEVQDRVAFHNTGPSQLPGVIVMSISDETGAPELDPTAEAMWALFNPTDDPITFGAVAAVGKVVELHPVLAASSDAVVKTSSFDSATGEFTVPARTTAVFVQLQDVKKPKIDLALDPIRVFRRSGAFFVRYSCTDNRDPDPEVAATLNGITVDDGTKVFLRKSKVRDHYWAGKKLFVFGPRFKLKVTCTDDAGNTKTRSVRAKFRPKWGWRQTPAV